MNMRLSLLEKHILYYLIVWHCLEISIVVLTKKIPYNLTMNTSFQEVKHHRMHSTTMEQLLRKSEFY